MGQALKVRCQADEIFDDDAVTAAAQGIQAREGVAHVATQLIARNDGAGALEEIIAVAAGDHPDTFAATALGGLHGETVQCIEGSQGWIHFVLLAQGKAQRRHGEVVVLSQQFGFQLVIDQRVKLAAVIAANVIEVAGVHAQHAELAQAPGFNPAVHGSSSMAEKRPSSLTLYPVYWPMAIISASSTRLSSGKLKLKCCTVSDCMGR